jgi:hypothetical protein
MCVEQQISGQKLSTTYVAFTKVTFTVNNDKIFLLSSNTLSTWQKKKTEFVRTISKAGLRVVDIHEIRKQELMGIDKREFAWEFSQVSCPGQTRTRVEWDM